MSFLKSSRFRLWLVVLSLFAISACAIQQPVKENSPRVFVVGDSTASYYKPERYPRTGWAMRLQNHLADGVEVVNAAVSGRSSRSFIEEGHFNKVKEQIKQGDYLLIQFGHNDQKTTNNRFTDPDNTYRDYLTQYINAARQAGANPVLVTSINRYKFSQNGKLFLTLGDYPKAMHELGRTLSVPVIALNQKTKTLYETLGPEKSKKLFLFYAPGEYAAYPNGVSDRTHLSVWGADEVVSLVVEDLKQIAPELF
ncbi:rhamnogalacturonan acetylesterase [Catenovulum sediminis]|uniref:Rhamnogalacturonan acetylesterase n=1 Tax=Catenovulum sediminis TaxID=1740262 RepID=A0ABV1RKI1_9ALTE|nr:rhamnogalacturonan acetylesterase [Catenovulum sediminis]